jgi:drug/metabolite transporter (DMT)-like permease
LKKQTRAPRQKSARHAIGRPVENIFAALGLRLLAIALIASLSAMIKLAEGRGAALTEIMFFRQACAMPVVIAWVAIGPGIASVRTQRLGAHALRTIIGLVSMALTFGAVMVLPLAEATTLQFTAPIFTVILGAIWLREPTGWRRWIAVLAGFIGVLIVVQPGVGPLESAGAALGILAACSGAMSTIQLRQIGQTEAVGTTVFWFTLLSLPVLLVFYIATFKHHDATTWALLVAMGVVGGFGQLALTGALRLAPVASVVPMDYSTLIWATLYGWVLFDTLPTPATWMGAPVIIGSSLYIVWHEHQTNRKVANTMSGSAPLA